MKNNYILAYLVFLKKYKNKPKYSFKIIIFIAKEDVTLLKNVTYSFAFSIAYLLLHPDIHS